MSLTPHQQKIRARYIGASEIPAVMGADEWRGAADVFLSKTGQLGPQGESSEAAELGHLIEPGMVEWAAKTLGVKTRANQLRVSKNYPMSATHDALIVGRDEGLQVKTTGIVGPRPSADDWGDEMTDQVPTRVLLQCTAEMAVSDLSRVYVPVLIGGVGRRMYVVDRDEKLVELVRGWAVWMWQHIENNTMPVGSPRIETLKRLIREPGKVVEIDGGLVSVWASARSMRLNAQKIEHEAERALLTALGDAEGWTSDAGDGTYLETVRKGYTVVESRYRTLRVKPKKENHNGGAEERDREGGGADDQPGLRAAGPGGGLPAGDGVRRIGDGAEGDGEAGVDAGGDGGGSFPGS